VKDEALLVEFNAALTEEWKVNGKHNLQTFCWILLWLSQRSLWFLGSSGSCTSLSGRNLTSGTSAPAQDSV
jgi:hypothetical protein